MCKAIKHYKKINNKGSALVTVLIAGFFAAIIVTILLFVTVRNYKQRAIEYQSKQNFYQAEKALDELKTILIEDCSNSCNDSYSKVLDDYINLSGEERQSTYYSDFVSFEKDLWEERTSDEELLDAIKELVSEDYKECFESIGDITYDEKEGYILFEDIVVSCSTIEGYYSRIKTNIRVDAPAIDWGNGASNSEISTVNMEDFVVYSNWQRD